MYCLAARTILLCLYRRLCLYWADLPRIWTLRLPNLSLYRTRTLFLRFLCLEVTSAQPQAARVPHHVGAQEKLHEAAPNILPPIARAHVEQQTPRRPWVIAASAPHEQAWPAIRDRARVRGGGTE